MAKFMKIPILVGACLAMCQSLEIAIKVKEDAGDTWDNLDQKARSTSENYGMTFLGRIGELRGYYLMKMEDSLDVNKREETAYRIKRMEEDEHTEWLEVQKSLKRFKRNSDKDDFRNFADPSFQYQWFLVDNLLHADINVTGVWDQGINGRGVVVAVVDDGLDHSHPDISENYFAASSYDFNFNDPDPSPTLYDDIHGTRCAGQIAAAPNQHCGVGVAFRSSIASIRILSGDINDAIEAKALSYRNDITHIYSNSWGPWDNGATVEGPGKLCLEALKTGVEQGRGGLGSIFVFASGNGGRSDDNCNFDGYTNSIYTISIGALDRLNKYPYYQESCTAHMAVTYSSNSIHHITTTDVKGQCTNNHGGTSAAAPNAAGIFALVLQARPDLTWRDLQWLVVDSAIPVDEDDSWIRNGAGYSFSNHYGFGKLSAHEIVERAKKWQLVPPKKILLTMPQTGREIPHGLEGVMLTFSVPAPENEPEVFFIVEHVTVSVKISHQKRGDVQVHLISPFGTVSEVATERSRDFSSDGFNNWVFMSVKNWGENGYGDWKVRVFDNSNPNFSGSLESASISVHGYPSTSSYTRGGTKGNDNGSGNGNGNGNENENGNGNDNGNGNGNGNENDNGNDADGILSGNTKKIATYALVGLGSLSLLVLVLALIFRKKSTTINNNPSEVIFIDSEEEEEISMEAPLNASANTQGSKEKLKSRINVI